jgi:hypothetical protein
MFQEFKISAPMLAIPKPPAPAVLEIRNERGEEMSTDEARPLTAEDPETTPLNTSAADALATRDAPLAGLEENEEKNESARNGWKVALSASTDFDEIS